jgi:ornithine carbamoyltransferase
VKRDFLVLHDFTQAEYVTLFARAKELKARRLQRKVEMSLQGRTLALVFEKSSTRTRLSFEAAMFQLGGAALDLPAGQSQLTRGEPVTDTARVVSRYVDAIVVRTHADERLRAFATASTVPVINGLSDGAHPVQVLTDLFTIEEKLGSVKGKKVAYVGDGSSNMGRSFVEAAGLFQFELRLASPEAYLPPSAEIAQAGQWVKASGDPVAAVKGADVVVTDVWTSMGQEAESAARLKAFHGYCVDAALMKHASPSAIVLHCLPAHRGEEISAEVIDGPQSVVFDEAENRLHVQKALLEMLLA